jgi:nucleoside-diphosphate-sugar epimerase
MDVSVINRGRTAARRPLPQEVTPLTADVGDADSMREALAGREFDCVVNFLSYGADDAAVSVERFRGHVGQYVHISTVAMYHNPVRRPPFVESTTRHNPFSQYARDKIAAEDVLLRAYDDEHFPVTIVRPSHTYDDAHPTAPRRLDRGRPHRAARRSLCPATAHRCGRSPTRRTSQSDWSD